MYCHNIVLLVVYQTWFITHLSIPLVGWHHHGLNGFEFEQTLGASEGQGSLVCCSPWGHKESDMTEQLNNNKIHSSKHSSIQPVWGTWFYFLLGEFSPLRSRENNTTDSSVPSFNIIAFGLFYFSFLPCPHFFYVLFILRWGEHYVLLLVNL